MRTAVRAAAIGLFCLLLVSIVAVLPSSSLQSQDSSQSRRHGSKLKPAQQRTTMAANDDGVPTVTEQPLLLYSWVCPYVQRVTLAAAFKKVDIPHIDIDLSNKPPWLTKYSPLGKVPAVTYLEGGEQQVLYESLALVFWVEEYFADKGVQLLPSSPAQRTLARIIMSRFDNNYVGVSYQLLRSQDIEEFRKQLKEAHTELTWLEDNTYLAKDKGGFLFGPEPSLVDAVVAPWLLRTGLLKHWRNVDVLAPHTKLQAYLERLKARPELQANLNSPNGSGWDAWSEAMNGAYTHYAKSVLDFSAAAEDNAPAEA